MTPAALSLVLLILPLTQTKAARKWRLPALAAAFEAELRRSIAPITYSANVKERITFGEFLTKRRHSDLRFLLFGHWRGQETLGLLVVLKAANFNTASLAVMDWL